LVAVADLDRAVQQQIQIIAMGTMVRDIYADCQLSDQITFVKVMKNGLVKEGPSRRRSAAG
jgi:hypothetical protein